MPGLRAAAVAALLALPGGIAGQVFHEARDVDGILVHRVESPSQAGETMVRVLLPDDMPAEAYRVLYVLPVAPQETRRWGNGLRQIRATNLHNQYRLICVEPTFSDWPWYAGHPEERQLQQESYFVDEVAPFIDRTYPTVKSRDGRLLVGFSKSGWGAWSLLLRHPGMFGRAGAWDAPLNKSRPDQFAMEKVFGTQENFERYRINMLLEQRAGELRGATRLVLTGYGNFREHHEAIHEQLMRLRIPHEYRDGPRREHHWESGWLPEMVGLLAAGE